MHALIAAVRALRCLPPIAQDEALRAVLVAGIDACHPLPRDGTSMLVVAERASRSRGGRTPAIAALSGIHECRELQPVRPDRWRPLDEQIRKYARVTTDSCGCDASSHGSVAGSSTPSTRTVATVVGHLRAVGFEFFEMNPASGSVFDQLSDAFRFPDYFGGNWDAVNDCMVDIDPPMRSALVWRDADLSAAADPKLFAKACSTLIPIFNFWSQQGRQAMLILVGRGTAFNRP